MRIIEIQSLKNGAHRNQESSITILPAGWAIIPENISIPNSFPFVDIEVEDNIVTSMTARIIPISEEIFQEAQSTKISELSTACNQAITAGMDVETTEGTEHFSLEETDQINLTAALSAVEQGAKGYPYHADKKLCRMFTAVEIKSIAETATKHKLYHTTLCNHLLIWARRVTTVEELEQITYTAQNLPTDLAENMAKVLAASGVTE